MFLLSIFLNSWEIIQRKTYLFLNKIHTCLHSSRLTFRSSRFLYKVNKRPTDYYQLLSQSYQTPCSIFFTYLLLLYLIFIVVTELLAWMYALSICRHFGDQFLCQIGSFDRRGRDSVTFETGMLMSSNFLRVLFQPPKNSRLRISFGKNENVRIP